MTAVVHAPAGDAPGRYASPIDAFAHGAHTGQVLGPPHQFRGRIGTPQFPAEAGRYHLYVGWFCPWSHRALIQRSLLGLEEVVPISAVDVLRDGRGWAFRESTGPDLANGFTLLRQAYDTTAPGYAGPVSVPVLWDTAGRRIVSNDPDTIDVDLATAFSAWATPGVRTYPAGLRDRIDRIDSSLGATVNHRFGRAAYDDTAREQLLAAFHDLDRHLRDRRYLLGAELTVADVRLWVSLVRYDAGPNAHGAVGPRLDSFAQLWRYARELYRLPAFGRTTRFDAFAAPFADLPDWGSEQG